MINYPVSGSFWVVRFSISSSDGTSWRVYLARPDAVLSVEGSRHDPPDDTYYVTLANIEPFVDLDAAVAATLRLDGVVVRFDSPSSPGRLA